MAKKKPQTADEAAATDPSLVSEAAPPDVAPAEASASAAPPQDAAPAEAPAVLTQKQKEALIKGHEQEIARLSAKPPVEYPRVLYKGTKGSYESRTVDNAAQREALGEGWAVSPADLED